ncbi:MAG: glycosyltransferase family 39 protein [Patescibacteria group bacterium]
MKRFTWYHGILLGIIAVAAFVRMVNLGTNPPAISWDEASIGYNAYTISTTGRDEHGTFLPLDTFAAFGDYKPPVPVYLTVPFVALLGLNETTVRLPSALSGVLTVLVLYLLVLELFRTAKHAQALGLVAAGVLTITPWHIMLSRAAFEANIALLFLVTGIWFVLKARESPVFFYVCWLPFVLGIYTFNSTRYAGPLIAGALMVIVYKSAMAAKKQVLAGLVIACIVLVPILPHLVSKQARLRFEEVSIFTDLRTVLMSNTRRHIDNFSWFSSALHNRRVGYAREYFIHFFDNLEPRFLFIKGDGNPKFSIQDTGQLLLVSAPFIVYGWLTVFRDYPVIAMFLLWWLLASIAPTAVARETPHALRIENGLPVYMIVTAYGIVMSVVALRKSRIRSVLFTVYCLLFIGNFAYFWHNFMSHYPKEYSGEWQYGYKQAITLAKAHKNEYDTIVLTESIGRPYIYALFYEQYPLKRFEETRDASFDAAGFYNVYGFGAYRFTKEGVGAYTGKTLYILPPKDVPLGVHIIETIRLLNGTAVLVAFE